MKNQFINLEKTSGGKYIKLYLAKYKTPNGEKLYEIASRKDVPDIINKTPSPDAVRILPYFFDENVNLKIVLIKEFRFAINQYIYGLPAGLIEENENPIESAKRELEEEIGAKVVKICQTENLSYSSAGFCDESIVCFEAEVELNQKQHLDKFEDIMVKVVDLETLNKMLDAENFGLQSRLQLRGFYYKQKYLEMEKAKKK